MNQMLLSMTGYFDKGKKTKREQFLAEMNQVVTWKRKDRGGLIQPWVAYFFISSFFIASCIIASFFIAWLWTSSFIMPSRFISPDIGSFARIGFRIFGFDSTAAPCVCAASPVGDPAISAAACASSHAPASIALTSRKYSRFIAPPTIR
jgi:hypothetical protein